VLLIGLTGNYGMGKSSVLPMFQRLGALTLDTDKMVKSLLREKPVLKKIKGLFGNDIFNKNGSLNKKKVSHVIFQNDRLRRSLEEILHPLVFEKIHLFLSKSKCQDKIIIIEVPLLFEGGYENFFDKIITVFSQEEKALNRLKKKGIKPLDAVQRLKSQLPIEEKIRRADFIIDNNMTIDQTRRQVKIIHKKLVEKEKDGDNNRPRNLQQKLS
jgi:dephospho-CoA kinase